ncbi:FAD-binding oxidoreductase [Primorskyibacter sp. S187A]|uniref:FAD-binding oxidoreductase n=1 Tax=Primorskyibacter sp. S187A TaxID=3415130 RepID=UPI003C7DA3E0
MLDDLTTLLGAGHVLTGNDASRYGKEWTGDYPSHPRAVLRPGSAQDVAAILKYANATGTPVVPVSGNTGLTGGTHAEGALMLSLERLNKIRDIRPAARVAVVEAGVVLSSLHDAAAEHDLIFPMTFGARGSCMIGGMLSTNAGGSNVLRYGSTRDLCLGLEVVTPQGEVMDLMTQLHKNNSGYDLRHLMIGAEGTLGIITAAVVKLFPAPKVRATAFVGMGSLRDALQLLNILQEESGGAVDAFEFMPAVYNRRYDAVHPGAALPFEREYPVTIMLELASTAPRDAEAGPDGSPHLAELLQRVLMQRLEEGLISEAVVAQNEAQRTAFWKRREAAGEITFDGNPLVNTDIALPLDAVADFMEAMEARLPSFNAGASSFSCAHLGDGNIHYTVSLNRDDPVLKDSVVEAIESEAMARGGSFSAEHGVGLSKLSTMARRKDPVALEMMRALKTTLDPNNILNPGKVLPRS